MEVKRIKDSSNINWNLPICEEIEKAIDRFNSESKPFIEALVVLERLNPPSYLINPEAEIATKIEARKTSLELKIISHLVELRDDCFGKFIKQKKD